MRDGTNELPFDVIEFCRAIFGDQANAETINRVVYARTIAEPAASEFIDDLAVKLEIPHISITAEATLQHITISAAQMAKVQSIAVWSKLSEETNQLLNPDDWQVRVLKVDEINNCNIDQLLDFINQGSAPDQQASCENGDLHISSEQLNSLMHLWNNHQNAASRTHPPLVCTDLSRILGSSAPANRTPAPPAHQLTHQESTYEVRVPGMHITGPKSVVGVLGHDGQAPSRS